MMSYFTSTRPWIGRWLVGVAVLHTVFAVVVFHAPLWDMAQRGVFDTVGQNPTAAATAWFVLFGFLMGLLGLATTPLERHDDRNAMQVLGVGVLVLCSLGLVLMPASGFWLGLPAGIALICKRQTEPSW
jgi:hypothetical protein